MMSVEEVDDDGDVRKTHDLPFAFSMMLPAFRGVRRSAASRGWSIRAASCLVDKTQRNPTFPERVRHRRRASPSRRSAQTPVPVGVPKTGFMIESMVTATALNIGALLRGKQPKARADLERGLPRRFRRRRRRLRGAAANSAAQRQLVREGRLGALAKVAFEKYFLRKMRRGQSEPFYERFLLRTARHLRKIKETA